MFHGDDAFSSAETISGHDPTVGQYQYDPANGSHDTYTYDADTLTGISEPDGVSLTEGYDSQGQNDGYSASDGTNTWSESETLNDQGQPSEITDTDPSGTYTRDLDYDSGSGLLTSESGGVLGGVKTSYAYNDDQTLASTTLGTDDAAYSEEGYTYDAQGRLSTLDANGTTFTYGYDDSTGLLHTVTSSTGVTTTYGYDTATENLTSITVTNASDTTLYSVSYEYNNDNQITSAAVTSTDAGGTTTTTDWAYTYDNMSQLQSAIASVGGTPVSGQDYTYTYDAAGNETGQGTVNDMNQLAADTYDGRGDVTDDGKSSYAYNPLGQLISVTPDSPTSGSQEVTYDYDDQGRMTIRNAYSWDSGTDSWSGTATTTKFAYDGPSLIGEFNVTFDGSTEVDTPVQTYTWGANGLQTIQIWNSGGTSVVKTLIPVADAGGNIVMLVNAADGSIDATYTYDPYGILIGSSGNIADSPFQFGGQNGTYTDAATDLVLMGARWYSPAQGRFLTEDPSGQDGGLNTYVYAENDPVNESDPSGLAPASTQPVRPPAPPTTQPVKPPVIFPIINPVVAIRSYTLLPASQSGSSYAFKAVTQSKGWWYELNFSASTSEKLDIPLKNGDVAKWGESLLWKLSLIPSVGFANQSALWENPDGSNAQFSFNQHVTRQTFVLVNGTWIEAMKEREINKNDNDPSNPEALKRVVSLGSNPIQSGESTDIGPRYSIWDEPSNYTKIVTLPVTGKGNSHVIPLKVGGYVPYDYVTFLQFHIDIFAGNKLVDGVDFGFAITGTYRKRSRPDMEDDRYDLQLALNSNSGQFSNANIASIQVKGLGHEVYPPDKEGIGGITFHVIPTTLSSPTTKPIPGRVTTEPVIVP